MKLETKQGLIRSAAMEQATKLLTKKERQELEAWERANITGDSRYGSTDWPGWDKLLAKLP